ncbi:MAG TPA: hypothetical protein VFT77_16920 [Reyranella sp.]|nr:hypothetical protein [Reyranella sp.]
MQVLTLIRTKLFGKLSQSAKVLLLRFCPQLRHLVYERIDPGHVELGLLQLIRHLLANLLELAKPILPFVGVAVEQPFQCLTLSVVELEVSRQPFQRAIPMLRRSRTCLRERRWDDPGPVDKARQNEAVQQQRQTEQDLGEPLRHVRCCP